MTKHRDVVKLILILSFITLWCLLDDIANISQGKAQCLYILWFSRLDVTLCSQTILCDVSALSLCEMDWFSMSGRLGRVTRVRYDSSTAYNLLIVIIISQVWSEINILVSECDNRDIIRCPVYTAPYARLSRALIGQSASILASDWSIGPIL